MKGLRPRAAVLAVFCLLCCSEAVPVVQEQKGLSDSNLLQVGAEVLCGRETTSENAIKDYVQYCKTQAVDGCKNEAACDLDPCNYYDHVGRSKWAVVIFHAPWCKMSEAFEPVVQELQKIALNTSNMTKAIPFVVAKVDGDKFAPLSEDYNVTTFPSIRVVPRDCYHSEYGCVTTFYKFERERNGESNEEHAIDIVNFMYSKANYIRPKKIRPAKASPSPEPEPEEEIEPPEYVVPRIATYCEKQVDTCNKSQEVCDLNECHFWDHVGHKKWTLVNFFTPWCHASAEFRDVYQHLRRHYAPNNNPYNKSKVLVAQVDGEAHPRLVRDLGIDQFPRLLLWPAGCYLDGGCFVNRSHVFPGERIGPNNTGLSSKAYADQIAAWVNQVMGEPSYYPFAPPPPPNATALGSASLKAGANNLLEAAKAASNVKTGANLLGAAAIVKAPPDLCKKAKDRCKKPSEPCVLDECNFWGHVGRSQWALVTLYTDNCPFRVFKSVNNALRAHYGRSMLVGRLKVNTTFAQSLAADYKVEGYPTTLLFPAECYSLALGCDCRFVTAVPTTPDRTTYSSPQLHEVTGALNITASIAGITKFVTQYKAAWPKILDSTIPKWPLTWAEFERPPPLLQSGPTTQVTIRLLFETDKDFQDASLVKKVASKLKVDPALLTVQSVGRSADQSTTNITLAILNGEAHMATANSTLANDKDTLSVELGVALVEPPKVTLDAVPLWLSAGNASSLSHETYHQFVAPDRKKGGAEKKRAFGAPDL